MTSEQHSAELPWARKHKSGMWEDELGVLGPYRPGIGPRSDPRGAFPTGPSIGDRFPDIVAPAHNGGTIDVHQARSGRVAVVVFYRSAVW